MNCGKSADLDGLFGRMNENERLVNALRVALEKVSDQMKNKTLANEDTMLMDIMTIQNGNHENEDVPELSLLELQQDEMWDDRASLASGDDFTFQLPTICRG
uniref:Uncharacterized protein n=1 Tax=Timema bartmani TaxID=61472 RepID=A0A7R9F3T0_9NEOP|nr:unnamed protein product [Timema bartmani]